MDNTQNSDHLLLLQAENDKLKSENEKIRDTSRRLTSLLKQKGGGNKEIKEKEHQKLVERMRINLDDVLNKYGQLEGKFQSKFEQLEDSYKHKV